MNVVPRDIDALRRVSEFPSEPPKVAFQVVVFCAEKPGANRVIPGYPTGAAQLELLYKSANKVNPNVGLTVLTNADTDLSRLQFPFERVDGEIDFSKLMFERTRMQREYLARYDGRRPIAFLDSDILLARDLGHVFESDFDIALTWRRDREMPFNGGVVLVNNRRRDAGYRFFERFERLYREQQADRAEWYGDQYALLEAVGVDPDRVAELLEYDSRGIRFRFLPCRTYNYRPPNRAPSLFHTPPHVVLIHFKGFSRRLMEPTWRFGLNGGSQIRPFRTLRVILTAIRFALSKRAYKRHLKSDERRRFNLDAQNTRSWRERAGVARDLINVAAKYRSQPVQVFDIGCGDGKLGVILHQDARAIDYTGFDLIPQNPNFHRLDLSKEEIPGYAHFAVVLGVLEYLPDIDAPLKRIRRCAPWLIVSHPASDLRKIKPRKARKKRNWLTYLSIQEFEQHLVAGGYDVMERRVTPDGFTCVWLCQVAADVRGD